MKIRWRAIRIALGALAAVSNVAAGQGPPPVEPGERVRVTARPELRRVVGEVRWAEGGLIEIESKDGPVSYRYADIVRLERSVGHPNHWLPGAAIGGGIAFGIGAGFGALLVSGLCDSPDGCGGDYAPAMLIVGGVFGVGGALVGLIFGGISSLIERWERVDRVAFRNPAIELGLLRQGETPFVGVSLNVP